MHVEAIGRYSVRLEGFRRLSLTLSTELTDVESEGRMSDIKRTTQVDAEPGTTTWIVITAPASAETIAAFWNESDARRHAAGIQRTDPQQGVTVRRVVIRGERRCCRLCGEPVVLDDIVDQESWRHADDANDLGDHTAEV